MSRKQLSALVCLSKSITENTAQIEEQLRHAGATPDPVLVYSVAKYFEALNRLAAE
jgi:hypothetical protein